MPIVYMVIRALWFFWPCCLNNLVADARQMVVMYYLEWHGFNLKSRLLLHFEGFKRDTCGRYGRELGRSRAITSISWIRTTSYQDTVWHWPESHVRTRPGPPFQVFKQQLSLPPVSHLLILLYTCLLSSRQKLQVPNSLGKILLSSRGQACGVFLENFSIWSVLEVNVMTIRIVFEKSATLMENESEGEERQMKSRISKSWSFLLYTWRRRLWLIETDNVRFLSWPWWCPSPSPVQPFWVQLSACLFWAWETLN